ncbi:MAG: hypothetical protein U1A28_04955 [Patescibacteria group bacterium]|nr:hypothetical protein [Patescibacteria group bacterium]
MPYGIRFSEDGKIAVFPAAFVSFKKKSGGRNNSIGTVMLIDSGATITSLPRGDAVALGYALESGERTLVRGFGSELIGFRHTVRCAIEKMELRIPVVFVDQPDVPRILGRAGVFEHFTIIFEEAKRRTAFIKKNTAENRAISALLDQPRVL